MKIRQERFRFFSADYGSKPREKIRFGAPKAVGRQCDYFSGSSCSQSGSKCNALHSPGTCRCGREGEPVVWAEQGLHIPSLRLAPWREANPVSPHGEGTTRKTAVTSYKSALDWRRVGR